MSWKPSARLWSGRWLHIAVLSAAVAMLAAACGGGGAMVAVTLQEFAVAADPSSVEAGEVEFEVTNEGPDDVHEFVVIRTDLDITGLPTDENGVVDETGEGIEVVDEIEDMAVGDDQSLTVELEAGNYALICNIWDEDEQEAHYQEGMRTSFIVE